MKAQLMVEKMTKMLLQLIIIQLIIMWLLIPLITVTLPFIIVLRELNKAIHIPGGAGPEREAAA